MKSVNVPSLDGNIKIGMPILRDVHNDSPETVVTNQCIENALVVRSLTFLEVDAHVVVTWIQKFFDGAMHLPRGILVVPHPRVILSCFSDG